MAFKKTSMNNYKTDSDREHCAIIAAVLQDSLIMMAPTSGKTPYGSTTKKYK